MFNFEGIVELIWLSVYSSSWLSIQVPFSTLKDLSDYYHSYYKKKVIVFIILRGLKYLILMVTGNG